MAAYSRRRLFSTLAAAALIAATGGCVKSTVGTTTKVTINVGKINAYLVATLNGAQTVLTVLEDIPGLDKYTQMAQYFIDQLTNVSNNFGEVAGGQATLDYNSENVGTVVDSIFDIFGQLAKFIFNIITDMKSADLSISASTLKKVQLTYNALTTLVSLLKASLYPSFVSIDPRLETSALRVLNA